MKSLLIVLDGSEVREGLLEAEGSGVDGGDTPGIGDGSGRGEGSGAMAEGVVEAEGFSEGSTARGVADGEELGDATPVVEAVREGVVLAVREGVLEGEFDRD